MKRAISLAAAVCVLAGLSSLHATAASTPKPQIEDPVGDANFLNDQGTGDGSFGDFTQADAGTVSDLIAVTLTNDAKNLYVNFQTEAAPPALSGVGYRARFNATAGPGTQCLYVEAFFPGGNNTLTAGEAVFRDACAGGEAVKAELLGTMVVVPRSAHKAFGKGAKLTTVQALSFLWSGSSYPAGVAGPMVDTTKVGKDFAFKK
ncbi:MAG TPA: hypothetical protein VG929_10340 [Actinomycetota bacterium]|nr:hypothetical protein [Actinomycetota bacterium]